MAQTSPSTPSVPRPRPQGLPTRKKHAAKWPPDDDDAPSIDDRLSRLMRTASSWQLPGVQPQHEEEVAAAEEDDQPSSLDLETADDRIIPNDHAPAATTFGGPPLRAWRPWESRDWSSRAS